MKKTVAYLAFITIVAIQFTSCKKCYVCNFSGAEKELCTDDFPDKNAGLKLSIDGYEKQGYVCNEK